MFSLFFKFNLRLPVIYKLNLKRSIKTESKTLELLRLLREMPQQKQWEKPKYSKRGNSRLKFRPSNVVLKVLGNGAIGSPRSVLLFTDTARYLFNCGEGTLRLTAEAGVKLSRLSNILVTYPSWENIGGMVNLALSLKEAGAAELCIHGHSNIESVYSNANKFVSLRGFIVTTKNCPHYGEFSDEVFDLKYVHLYPSNSNNVNKSTSDQSMLTVQQEESESEQESVISEEEKYFELNSDEQKKFKGILNNEHIGRMNLQKCSRKTKRCQSEVKKKRIILKGDFALSYICRTKPTFGTLLIEECMKLGVPPGPALGKLKKGEDITLEDGTVVKSADVKEPDIPGAVIIFIECPTVEYLDSLLKEPAFCRHQSGEISPDDVASVVVHFTSSKVLKTPKYQEWISRFSRETKHLYINEDNRSVGSFAVHRMQYKLNALQPEIFPLLQGCSPNFLKVDNYDIDNGHSIVKCLEEVKKSSETNEMTFTETVFCKCESNPHIVAETFSEINIRPVKQYDYRKCLILKKDQFLENIWEEKNVKNEVEEFKLKLKGQLSNQPDKQIYPKIVFLGTGSSKPSLTRNTSGILIFLDDDKAMIFDCGEGTYNQLVNLFGKEKSDEILRKVKMIYISHMHADHHTGLITLLKERKAAFENTGGSNEAGSSSKESQNEKDFFPVYLMAPVQMTRWLHLFNIEIEPIVDLYYIIPNSNLMNKNYMVTKQKECLDSLNLIDMKTTLVHHCPDAFGVAVTHMDSWKLTYSGDTLPCRNLVNLGMNSDILIHEATHDDSLMIEAERKMHSTTSQAIEIGKEMNAKYILLTHFSQRYSHVPLIGEKFENEKVGIAFDNMIVNFNQLPILSKLTEALKILFAQRIEKLEERHNLMGMKRRLIEDNSSPDKRVKVSH